MMLHNRGQNQAHAFYKRWSVPIFAFCRWFLGEEKDAEEATVETFLAYLRRGPSPKTDRVPDELLKCAVDSVRRRCPLRPAPTVTPRDLAGVIPLLPCEQRAVFVLCAVLGIEEPSIAVATGMPREQVRQLWFASLMRARELLQKDFIEEQMK